LKNVLDGVSFEVKKGERISRIGENGSGKSTLIKIILGKDNDFSGEIKINTSVKIGYIPQEIKFQNESDTILEYFLKNFGGSET
jgi:ABC transporter related